MGFRTILREFLLLNECTSSVQWDDGDTRARKLETASWRWSGTNAWNRLGTHHWHICRRVDSEIHHGRIGKALWYTDLQTSTVQEHRHSYRGGTRAIEIRPEIGVVRSRSHFGTFTNRRNAREWTDHPTDTSHRAFPSSWAIPSDCRKSIYAWNGHRRETDQETRHSAAWSLRVEIGLHREWWMTSTWCHQFRSHWNNYTTSTHSRIHTLCSSFASIPGWWFVSLSDPCSGLASEVGNLRFVRCIRNLPSCIVKSRSTGFSLCLFFSFFFNIFL